METMTMNDTSDTRDTSNINSTLIGFAVGAVVGAGLALLLAPDSGKKTRERLASTARQWSANAGQAIGQARDTMTDLGTDAQSAIRAGQEAFLHDRAARDTRSERRMAQGTDGAAGFRSLDHAEEEVAR
jgi:gas vesicle protein